MRALTSTAASGAGLRHLAHALSLERTTVHRLMQTLVDEGLAEQDRSSKRYYLGLDFFTLAAAASNRFDIQDVAQAGLARLAASLGDSVFFSLRSAYDAVCVQAHAGQHPVKTLVMDVGARYPLGAGATGVAFVAPLPDDEVQEILQHNAPRRAKYHAHTHDRVLAAIARFRDVGFAPDDGKAAHGTHSIAVALPDRRGRPLTPLTVACAAERMPLSRRAMIAAAIQAEGGKISEAMWRKPDASRHWSTWVSGTDSLSKKP